MKIQFLFVVILLSTASILEGQSPTPVPADPCNRGPFCADGSLAANPENCTSYYSCGSGLWYLMSCPGDTLFDNISMTCTEPNKATCQWCPPFSWTTPPPVTIDPGTCDNLTQCETGKNYPDRSNCTTYYYCESPTRLLHMSCSAGFVFDIYVADCVTSTNDFTWDVCYYRCVTPPPPTTESTRNTASSSSTTSTASTTSADTTDFIAYTALTTSVTLTTSSATETTSGGTETTSDATETTSGGTETTSDATETTSGGTETTSYATETTSHATEATSSAAETTSDATETTADRIGPNTNDEEKLILLIVIIVVVLIIIAIIITAVCCVKKKPQSKMESENDIHMSLCHRTFLYIVSGQRPSASPSKEKKIRNKSVLLTTVQMNSVAFEKATVTPISDGVIGSPEYEEIFLEFEAKHRELWKHGSSEAEMKNGSTRGIQSLNALSLEEEQRCIKTTKPMETLQPGLTRHRSPMDELL